MVDYVPPTVGERRDGMEWAGIDWTAVCPACDVAMTEFNACAELTCPVCGVSYIARIRALR